MGTEAPTSPDLHRLAAGVVLASYGVPYASGINRNRLLSTDGEHWAARVMGLDSGMGETGYGIDSFATDGEVNVAAGNFMTWSKADDWQDRGVVLRSTDGRMWKRELTLDRAYASEVVHVDGRFLVRSSTEETWVSKDGLHWKKDPKRTNIVGTRGRAEWRGRLSRVDQPTNGVPDGRVQFESAPSAAAEPDELDAVLIGWHRYRPVNRPSWVVAATRERFLAIGRYDYDPRVQGPNPPSLRPSGGRAWHTEAWMTKDGKRWTRCDSRSFRVFAMTTFADRFVAVGHDALWTSRDGCEWSELSDVLPTKASDGLSDVMPLGDNLLVVGVKGTGTMSNKGPNAKFLSFVWHGRG